MTSFVFQGKTFKIVEDIIGELVAGCKRCHFHGDPIGCSDVDGHGTGRVRCSDGNHHYEEVQDARVQ